MLSRKVAFVCTGNMCRSPAAEYLFRAMIPKGWNIEVCSFGTMTTGGSAASNNAMIVGMEEGVDLTPHRSRPLKPSELRSCDLILTMTESHQQHILLTMPDLFDRTFTLKEYGKDSVKEKDIGDPIGGDLKVYRKNFQQIKNEIQRILPILGRNWGFS